MTSQLKPRRAAFTCAFAAANQGMKIWFFSLNGKEGMVFLNGNPKSRFNVNVGIYLE